MQVHQHVTHRRLKALCGFFQTTQGAQALVAMRRSGVTVEHLTHACASALVEDGGTFADGSVLRRIACAGVVGTPSARPAHLRRTPNATSAE